MQHSRGRSSSSHTQSTVQDLREFSQTFVTRGGVGRLLHNGSVQVRTTTAYKGQGCFFNFRVRVLGSRVQIVKIWILLIYGKNGALNLENILVTVCCVGQRPLLENKSPNLYQQIERTLVTSLEFAMLMTVNIRHEQYKLQQAVNCIILRFSSGFLLKANTTRRIRSRNNMIHYTSVFFPNENPLNCIDIFIPFAN